MTGDAAVPAKRPGKGETIAKLLGAFEAAAHRDEEGIEFWLARGLAPLLGYEKYANFLKVAEKAKNACRKVARASKTILPISAKWSVSAQGLSD